MTRFLSLHKSKLGVKFNSSHTTALAPNYTHAAPEIAQKEARERECVTGVQRSRSIERGRDTFGRKESSGARSPNPSRLTCIMLAFTIAHPSP